MCGILAVLDSPTFHLSVDRHARRADHLLDRLRHRGPDGRGTFGHASAWLGHRRLAIVDPAGGAQPFEADGLAWAVNGEIYNHAAIRTRFDLTDLPASDAAVVGPLWRALGLDALREFDGQFAFVAVDTRSGDWIAARDHVGICPLYLGRHDDGSVWFASEMKALIDDCAHVELVPPGHAWVRDEGGLRRVRWYAPAWQRPQARPARPACLDKLREGLIDAVVKRLMCDVPCGLLLSGGLDSSLIAAIAVRYAHRAGNLRCTGRRFRTFSIGLEGAPDLAPARQVADFLGTDHHEFHFTLVEALAAVPHVVRHLESFEQIRTAVPTYLLAKRVRETGVKMVLSGEGADEMFGGYLYFHRAPSPHEFFLETVRKVTRLHQFDVMRANKAPMAFGLEVRFPFLDRRLLDMVMSLDPREKIIHAGCEVSPPRREKHLLRKAFDSPTEPWLPPPILWRQKEQFSDGCGYEWVDRLREYAEQRLSPVQWRERRNRFGFEAPNTHEQYWMRELFDAAFVAGRSAGASAVATVPTGRSIACSTPEALAWDPAWLTMAGDISGRAMGVHTGSSGFTVDPLDTAA